MDYCERQINRQMLYNKGIRIVSSPDLRSWVIVNEHGEQRIDECFNGLDDAIEAGLRLLRERKSKS
jgi:hypothetical protein